MVLGGAEGVCQGCGKGVVNSNVTLVFHVLYTCYRGLSRILQACDRGVKDVIGSLP